MKISEFAQKNNVTAKMLRHYDEIGLLKPKEVDSDTGYRIYSQEQAKRMSWISILKNLGFSLKEISRILDGPADAVDFIKSLKEKRVEISHELDIQISRKIQIDRLVTLIEKIDMMDKEDIFMYMNKTINLMDMSFEEVNEIKKHMPKDEIFLEKAYELLGTMAGKGNIVVMRMDLWHFKQVNDDYGHEVGDKVIVAFYQIFEKCVNELNAISTVCRSGGDEFLAMFAGGHEDAEKTISHIFAEIDAYDFASLGSSRKLGSNIGALIKPVDQFDLRKAISETYDLMLEAKQKNAMNTFVIR